MNLTEALTVAAEYGQMNLAYSILWAAQKAHVVMTDDYSKLLTVNFDSIELAEMIKQNPLGIKVMNLYTSRINGNQFVFIFAESEIAAKMYFKTLYGKSSGNMTDVSSRMDMYMWCEVDGYISFREMKNRTLDFPSVALVYEKEDKPAAQVEHEYFQMFGRKLMTNEEKQAKLESGDTLFY